MRERGREREREREREQAKPVRDSRESESGCKEN